MSIPSSEKPILSEKLGENHDLHKPHKGKKSQEKHNCDQSSSGHSCSEDDAEVDTETQKLRDSQAPAEDKDKSKPPEAEEVKDTEEDEEEEDKNENMVEAKDFLYFKKQCKFEKFVHQLNEGKSGLLGSFIGGEECKDEQPDTEPDVVVGFDTRFTYTKEGLMVYDIHSHMKLDKLRPENKGITLQDYKVF